MDWDPCSKSSNGTTQPPPICLRRIKRDLMLFESERPLGIFVEPDESDMTLVHALIIGPAGTPFEGGFFYFVLRFPAQYPIVPPKVKLMTTGGSTVRFNPNLDKDGGVCLSNSGLSILDTWEGPTWSPAQTLLSVLISIQSNILTETPYQCESYLTPLKSYLTFGFEKFERAKGFERVKEDRARYNETIQHETLRVAVIGMIENDFKISIPKSFQEIMENTFIDLYNVYERIANQKISLTGQKMNGWYVPVAVRGTFQYSTILKRLKHIHLKITTKLNVESPTPPTSKSAD